MGMHLPSTIDQVASIARSRPIGMAETLISLELTTCNQKTLHNLHSKVSLHTKASKDQMYYT